MSNFSFKSLFKRLADTSIPKVYLYVGGGFLVLIIIGMIVGNMYLQEMLFFEGVEKSVPLFTEEELRDYGEYYKELELEFENKVASYIQNYANRTTRRGDKIKWGVYGQYNTEDLKNDDFVDGVTIKYAKTEGRTDGESNFQDILSAVAILVDQNQSKDETKIKELIKELFKMSHTLNGKSTDLYPCTHGCFCDFYHCSDANNTPPFSHCNIKYQPFPITYHDEYEDYPNEEDFNIVDIVGECEVCKGIPTKMCYKQRGCQQVGTCYHGIGGDGSESTDGKMGQTEPIGKCSKYHIEYDCPGHTHTDSEGNEETTYCEETDDDGNKLLGCAGWYQCEGHDHYECTNGHFYVCCMGHSNVTISIKIMYLDEMIKTIQNGYEEE